MSGQAKKTLLEGQYCFLFSSIWQFFFVLIQSFDFSSFFLLIQSSNERSVLYLCFCFCQVQLLCGHKLNSERGKKKQMLVKTFRIKKVPSKRNVFDDVNGWLSSVCNNMLYLTTQVVKRECHL